MTFIYYSLTVNCGTWGEKRNCMKMFSNVHNLSEICLSFLIHSEFQIQQKKQDMTHHMLMVVHALIRKINFIHHLLHYMYYQDRHAR